MIFKTPSEDALINARHKRMRRCHRKHRVLPLSDSSSAWACPALSESYLPDVTRISLYAGKSRSLDREYGY